LSASCSTRRSLWRLSHDAGADGILQNRSTGHTIIIQCKHYAPNNAWGAEAVDDLLRARGAYALPSAQLVALTTAAEFSGAARNLSARSGAILIDRSRLAEWGRSIP
jgi:HJR/Mrr/RecB family endonuclease